MVSSLFREINIVQTMGCLLVSSICHLFQVRFQTMKYDKRQDLLFHLFISTGHNLHPPYWRDLQTTSAFPKLAQSTRDRLVKSEKCFKMQLVWLQTEASHPRGRRETPRTWRPSRTYTTQEEGKLTRLRKLLKVIRGYKQQQFLLLHRERVGLYRDAGTFELPTLLYLFPLKSLGL